MSTQPIIYVYKVKRDGLKWEETPTYTRQHFAPDDEISPSALAQKIANAVHDEVRWNSLGSQQGHYVHPTSE